MTSHIKGVPGQKSAAHIAGRTIYARGPATQEQVLTYASFGKTSGAQSYNLTRAITEGWLVDLPGGLIGLSDKARHYYAGTERAPKEMGSLATPRENLHAMAPLSAKYRLNVRGPRSDAWNNSTRAIPSHHPKVNS